MWVRSGDDVLETRPGYEFLSNFFHYDAGFGSLAFPTTNAVVVENPADVFTNTSALGGLTSAARIYFGAAGNAFYEARVTSATGIPGWLITIAAPNTTSARMRYDYWNGAVWAPLPVNELSYASTARTLYTRTSSFLNASTGTSVVLGFYPPRDWQRTTINGTSTYWVRATQIANAALTGATSVGATGLASYSDATSKLYDLFVVSHTGGTLTIALHDLYYLAAATDVYQQAACLTATAGAAGHNSLDTGTQNRYVSPGEGATNAAGGVFGLATPATIAYIPQVNEFFIAHNNAVYNIAPSRLKPVATLLTEDGSYAATNFGVLKDFFKANVEDDPAFVADSLSPLNKDTVSQLNAVPAASTVVYHDNVLWATRIKGERGVVRWTAPAVAGIYLGYRVWPTINFAVLPTDEEVTGAIALHENLMVTTARSVFAMVKAGTDTNNFTSYAPVRVADVGCLAQSSMVNIPGRAIWLANEGVFMFDGTPNFKMISDPIHEVIGRVNFAKAQYVSAVHWDFYNMYVLSVPLDNSDKNNALLLYDYERGAWWVWDDISAKRVYVFNNELHFVDYIGNVFKFSSVKNDHGAAIDAYVLTHRMGKDERKAKTARDVRVTAYGQNVTVSLLAGDREQASTDIEFGDSDDAVFDTAVFDSATWPDEEIKERRVGVRQAGRWFQLKIATSDKTTPLRLNNLAVGYIDEGRR